MAHFAKVNLQGIVEQVIVAEQEYIDTLPDAGFWVQTSYNTYGGVHYQPNSEKVPSADQSKALRKNYASIGYTYDKQRDAFIPPKPCSSWVLVEETCNWVPPIPYPSDGKRYTWDEAVINWVEVKEDTP